MDGVTVKLVETEAELEGAIAVGMRVFIAGVEIVHYRIATGYCLTEDQTAYVVARYRNSVQLLIP